MSKAPWLSKEILKSTKHKNLLFLKSKYDPNLLQTYRNYRNRLTNIIRNEKLNYRKQILTQLKNNSRKIWLHLNNLMNSNHNKNNNIFMDADILNNFFTSYFNKHLITMPGRIILFLIVRL